MAANKEAFIKGTKKVPFNVGAIFNVRNALNDALTKAGVTWPTDDLSKGNEPGRF